MDRRKSLKLIATGAVAVPAVIAGCNTGADNEKQAAQSTEGAPNLDRNPAEAKYEKQLQDKEAFFTAEEMATITVLADIIIPADDISGSASDAKVPEFIGFIVKDMPQHQVPLRGGLRWLDLQSVKQYGQVFRACTPEQQLEMVDAIAYPQIEYTDHNGKKVVKGKPSPGLEQGVAFFSLFRNLTATGFYTSEIGVKDLGYAGNKPNKWNGVPEDVLRQYRLAYTEKELRECVDFS